MFRTRPKRPILRAQLAAMNPPASVDMRSGPVWRAIRPQTLPKAAPGVPGEICWWTESHAKCCIYDGIAFPFCVTYPDVDE